MADSTKRSQMTTTIDHVSLMQKFLKRITKLGYLIVSWWTNTPYTEYLQLASLKLNIVNYTLIWYSPLPAFDTYLTHLLVL